MQFSHFSNNVQLIAKNFSRKGMQKSAEMTKRAKEVEERGVETYGAGIFFQSALKISHRRFIASVER